MIPSLLSQYVQYVKQDGCANGSLSSALVSVYLSSSATQIRPDLAEKKCSTLERQI